MDAQMIMTKMAPVEGSSCLVWTAAKIPTGYGSVVYDGRIQMAHRAVYQIATGPIPDGHVVDHLCRNTSCVNPVHLEAVTQSENLRRAPTSLAAINGAKTECKRGHALIGRNVMPYRRGNSILRRCRSCVYQARSDKRARESMRRGLGL